VLDAIDKAHDFALPEALVANEFDMIWRRYQASPQANPKSEDEAKAEPSKSEDEQKADIRKIAERRVRLGLVIAEIGEQQKIDVTQDELKRALVARARGFPGQERAVYEFYEKNPGAVVELRAPIFEDKVIDHILEQAKPTDRKVSVEDLMKPEEGPEWASIAAHEHAGHDHDHGQGHHHDHDHGHHDHGHHDHDHQQHGGKG
jgi:trigger factor